MEARGQIPVGPPIKDPLPSYWQEPKSPLANVIEPETDNATQIYDYAIIGSGISGTMIAYNLLERHPGARIIMLEAREICSGATGRNGGHTKAATYRSYLQYVSELGKEEALKIARLEYANIIATHALAVELEIDCESQLCNTVDVIYDQKTFEEGKRAIDALRADATDDEKEQREMAWYKVYEQGEALKAGFPLEMKNQNPEIQSKEEIAGVFEYLAGRIHAYQFTTGILQHCVEKGLQLCANTPVHALQPSTKSAEPDSHLWDVFTQYSNITARNVMLATNGYTPYLLRALQGAIVPMRGQITAQKPGTENKLLNPLSTTYSFIYRSGYEYMIPRPLPDGKQHIIIGGGLGRLPDGGSSEFGTVNDGALNPQISRYLRNSLTGYFGVDNWGKDDEEERVVQEWTGIMGATADGRPYIGSVPGMKGVWISAGFNGHGMVLCLKSAEALVRMLHGGENDGRPEWFPESFLISVKRLAQARFKGRKDMRIDE